MATKTWMDKITSLDRRIIYVLIILAVAIPLSLIKPRRLILLLAVSRWPTISTH